MTTNPSRLPLFSIALLSATALAFEVLLVRLLSIVQWHHYAYMIISLALLGYGASGTFLAIFQQRLLSRFNRVYILNIVLFGIATCYCFLIAQQWTFHPEELLFDPGQWFRLAFIYLILAVPFFFAANAIGLALIRHHIGLSRLYAADLVGAAIGSIAIVALLFVVFPETALRLVSVIGMAAALVAALELRLTARRRVWFIFLILLTTPLLIPASWLQLQMSPYKDLSQTLRIAGMQVVEQQSSPLGLISVVESTQVPFRYAPEASLNLSTEPPPQLGIYVDGHGPSVINRVSGDTNLDYLNQYTSALPYALARPDHVLVLGAGGGTSILQALQQGAKQVTGIELNPQVISLVQTGYADYAGALYDDERVTIIAAETRGFLTGTDERFDVIQLPILESQGASSTGLFSLSEDYLHTVQAFQLYLERLAPDGYLLLNRWVKLPPRDSLKLFAMMVAALTDSGVDDIAQRLVLIRGWQTNALLVKNGVLTDDEIEAAKAFCAERSFDLAYYPGIKPAEANRYNQLAAAYYHDAAQALLGRQAAQFQKNYKFNLTPATDDRPFFYQFFRWQSLPEILGLFGRGGAALVDTGYLVMVVTLLQSMLASLFLILLPLFIVQRGQQRQQQGIRKGSVLVYFTALGLGFLFIEIAFIQKLMLLLHHPVYAVAVALAAFLLFAGLGSAYTQGLVEGDGRHGRGILLPAGVIISVGLLELVFIDALLASLQQLSLMLRTIISIVCIAPLAFCMGMPFPRGMAQLAAHSPALMAWAWGINGCASVISAVLASLIAIHYGFNSVILLALLFYLLAAVSFPRPARADPGMLNR